MTQLLQLDAKLEKVPGERMLWVWSCLQKRCRRKEGSVRAWRGVRVTEKEREAHRRKTEKEVEKKVVDVKDAPKVGDMVFGSGGLGSGAQKANPFSKSGAPAAGGMFGGSNNPFATKPEPKPEPTLPETFAQKLSLNLPPPAATPSPAQDPTFFGPAPPWPTTLPNPFPKSYLDADYETLEKQTFPEFNLPVDYSIEPDSTPSGSKDLTTGEEGHLDTHFQKFADRVAQNPDQVLRYYGHPPVADPLFFTKKDDLYKTLGRGKGKVPKCKLCGKRREVECQLMPGAIMALERDEVGLDGMEWGTVLVASCTCVPWERVDREGCWYGEEWCGVQWEERK